MMMSKKQANPDSNLTSLAILTTLRDTLPSLCGEAHTLAEYVLANYALIPKLSLVQLAEEANVSPGTINHFCKITQINAYHDLQEALAQIGSVAARVYFEGVDPFDLEHTIQSVFENIAEVLKQTLDSLDMNILQQAVDAISQARRIVVFGVGTSAGVAKELAHRLGMIGLHCHQYDDQHRQLIAMTSLGKGDVAIAISHSGRTKSVVNTLRVAREQGLTTMCITDFSHSPVTDYTDICISAVHSERALGIELAATRAAQLALVDSLATAVALCDKESAMRSLALNEKLLINLRY